MAPPSNRQRAAGWVAEWSKAPVLKTGVVVRLPWVRIPPHPRFYLQGLVFTRSMAGLPESATHHLHHHGENYVLTLSMLYGVPLETLLYDEDELANLRRRVERLRRRLGLPGPGQKADAA
jgi:hypothetical protein